MKSFKYLSIVYFKNPLYWYFLFSFLMISVFFGIYSELFVDYFDIIIIVLPVLQYFEYLLIKNEISSKNKISSLEAVYYSDLEQSFSEFFIFSVELLSNYLAIFAGCLSKLILWKSNLFWMFGSLVAIAIFTINCFITAELFFPLNGFRVIKAIVFSGLIILPPFVNPLKASFLWEVKKILIITNQYSLFQEQNSAKVFRNLKPFGGLLFLLTYFVSILILYVILSHIKHIGNKQK